jgi:hypothetical protein
MSTKYVHHIRHFEVFDEARLRAYAFQFGDALALLEQEAKDNGEPFGISDYIQTIADNSPHPISREEGADRGYFARTDWAEEAPDQDEMLQRIDAAVALKS